jgi:predicted Na+-dependent transporter
MLYKLILIGISVCIAFGASIARYAEEKTAMALTQLVGAVFLLVVIFAHVSEAFRFIPSLGWGRPNTLGHYIDLVSAIAGAILLPIGYLGRRYARRINSN